jgi:hypothetical protein
MLATQVELHSHDGAGVGLAPTATMSATAQGIKVIGRCVSQAYLQNRPYRHYARPHQTTHQPWAVYCSLPLDPTKSFDLGFQSRSIANLC